MQATLLWRLDQMAEGNKIHRWQDNNLASSATMMARVSQHIIMRDNIDWLQFKQTCGVPNRNKRGRRNSSFPVRHASVLEILDSVVQLQTGDHRKSSLDIHNANALRVMVVGCRWVYLYGVRSIVFVNLSQLQDTSRVCFVDGSGQAGRTKALTHSLTPGGTDYGARLSERGSSLF